MLMDVRSSLPGALAEFLIWPVCAAVLAWRGHWWALVVVGIFTASDFVSARLIHYQRKRIEQLERKRNTIDVPDGWITISIDGSEPVAVPPTSELIDATRHIIEIVEGTDG